MSQITKNLQKLAESSPASGRIINEDGIISNQALLLGAPYIIATDDVNDWSAPFPNTSVEAGDPLWNGSIKFITTSTESSVLIKALAESINFLPFQRGRVEFWVRITGSANINGTPSFSLVSVFNETQLAITESTFTLPQGYNDNDIAKITVDLTNFSIIEDGGAKLDFRNIIGIAFGIGSDGQEVAVEISGLSFYTAPAE